MKWEYVVIALLYSVIQLSGNGDILAIDCMKDGVEEKPTTIKCHYKKSDLVIQWINPFGKRVLFCNLTTVTCNHTTIHNRFSAHVQIGNQDHPQMLILDIKQFRRKTDAGQWTCQVGPTKHFCIKKNRHTENSLTNELNHIIQEGKFDNNAVRLFVDDMELLGTLKDLAPSTAKSVLGAVSSLSTQLGLKKNTLENKHKTFQRLVAAVDQFLLKVSLDNGPFSNADKKLSAYLTKYYNKYHNGMIMTVSRGSSDNRITVVPTSNKRRIDQNIVNRVVFPQSLFDSLNQMPQENSTVAFTAYDDKVLFYDPKIREQNHSEKHSMQVNSEVISAKFANTEIRNLKEPVFISLVHKHKKSFNPQCVYWSQNVENDSWEWSTNGCIVNNTEKFFTICACQHLTHFALIMDVYQDEADLSDSEKLALFYISFTGCCLSMVALFLTIMTFAAFRNLRRDVPSKILLNLCVSLFATNFIFVFGMQNYTFMHEITCKVVAISLHYFLLSALTWMGVEAINMYFCLVVVFMSQIRYLVLKYTCVGWGIPLIIVTATVLHGYGSNYGLLVTKICWIKNPAFYISFLAPVAAILLMNSIVFGLVLYQIVNVSGGISINKNSKSKIRTQLQGAVIIIILLGLTYLFAIVAIGKASVVFHFLFSIFNSLQGLFIFIFYCLLKKDTRDAWKSTLPSSITKSSHVSTHANSFSRVLNKGTQSEISSREPSKTHSETSANDM